MTDRIAVVRALQLGDMLVTVPALRALRQLFPHAEITLIGLPWAGRFADRFSRYIDRFVEFPGWPGIIEAEYDAARTEAFLQEQRAYGYDLALQMHGSGGVMNAFVLALGASAACGYYLGQCPAGLFPVAVYPDDIPEVQRPLGIVELLGAVDPCPDLEFPITDADRAELAGLLPPAPPGTLRVGMHPGASAPARRWPPERFAAVASYLSRHWNAQVVLTGGPGEEEIAGTVERLAGTPMTNLAGQTSLGSLAALIDSFDLFITNDTGPSHIATALGTPSVRLFGPADVRRWAPLDTSRHRVLRHPVACNPCSHRICPIDHPCLLGIETGDVLAAAENLVVKAEIA